MYLFGGYICTGFCARFLKNKDQIRDCATAHLSMGPAKHEKAAIFPGKMSGFRMFESILRVQSTKKST